MILTKFSSLFYSSRSSASLDVIVSIAMQDSEKNISSLHLMQQQDIRT